MRALGAIMVAGVLLAGCQTVPKPACPAGQAQLRTAQLFFSAKAPATLNEIELRRFVDQEVTPRFPDGVTVVDGGGNGRSKAEDIDDHTVAASHGPSSKAIEAAKRLAAKQTVSAR